MDKTGERPLIHSNADPAGQGRLSAPSALRNVGPITKVLKTLVPDTGAALEIASGTGQHVVAFAKSFPALSWQPTDIAPERLASVDAWVAAEKVENVHPAQCLDASRPDWDVGRFDLVLISNLFHLISNTAARNVLSGAARSLKTGGRLFLYGPFRENNRFRSAGDAEFHANIVAAEPECGYKSVEWMQKTTEAAGLVPNGRHEMPAHNLALVFQHVNKR